MAYDRQYYLKNKEAALARQRKYRATTKGKSKDLRYEHSPEGKLVRAKVNRRYRLQNAEKISQYYKRKHRTPAGRFAISKSRARQRNYAWTLTIEQYAYLISLPCFYCNGSLSPAGIGLDRVINSLGYTVENVVPCCKRCNDTKGRKPLYDFLRLIAGG